MFAESSIRWKPKKTGSPSQRWWSIVGTVEKFLAQRPFKRSM